MASLVDLARIEARHAEKNGQPYQASLFTKLADALEKK